MTDRPDFEAYFDHAMEMTEAERRIQRRLLPELPETIIDCHVHTGPPEAADLDNLPEHVLGHMGSTYPYTTVEQSEEIDGLLAPSLDTRKIRFAHAFHGVDHQAVNEYLLGRTPEQDRVALFGISENSEHIAYTIDELESEQYSGLKMYYMASEIPRSELFDYFPPPILDTAEHLDIPIILHLPKSLHASLDELDELARRNPDLKVVLAHIGVTFLPYDGLEADLGRVARHENMSVDTSGVTDERVVAAAVRALGAERVLFGSDEPLNLLRDVAYENPERGTRLLTDYPYHWVDQEEQATWRHLAEGRFMHNHWQQLEALLGAIKHLAATPEEEVRLKRLIFHDNSERTFNFGNVPARNQNG
jgi:hypothetical protein